MTIADLIEHLQDAADALGDEAEVRLAMQPEYPLAFTVAAVAPDEPAGVAWIAAGAVPFDESPYAPRAAWEAL